MLVADSLKPEGKHREYVEKLKNKQLLHLSRPSLFQLGPTLSTSLKPRCWIFEVLNWLRFLFKVSFKFGFENVRFSVFSHLWKWETKYELFWSMDSILKPSFFDFLINRNHLTLNLYAKMLSIKIFAS